MVAVADATTRRLRSLGQSTRLGGARAGGHVCDRSAGGRDQPAGTDGHGGSYLRGVPCAVPHRLIERLTVRVLQHPRQPPTGGATTRVSAPASATAPQQLEPP